MKRRGFFKTVLGVLLAPFGMRAAKGEAIEDRRCVVCAKPATHQTFDGGLHVCRKHWWIDKDLSISDMRYLKAKQRKVQGVPKPWKQDFDAIVKAFKSSDLEKRTTNATPS